MEDKEIGKVGEEIAAHDLIAKGCKIIVRNYRQKFGEIDIVARAKDGLLLFIEVKTKVAERGAEMKPEDNMTPDKIRKFKKIAEFYALRYPELVGERGWRADVAAVYLFPEYLTPLEVGRPEVAEATRLQRGRLLTGLTKLKNNFAINYYENIF